MESDSLNMDPLIVSIRSGGQTGSDRGALDAAIEKGFPIHGWCPKGGWAEDCPDPPGLLGVYPGMVETPSADLKQRTEWNVRDSDVTMVFGDGSNLVSKGTALTMDLARKLGKPLVVIASQNVADVLEDLRRIGNCLDVNVAGPRESERPGSYEESFQFISRLLEKSRHQ